MRLHFDRLFVMAAMFAVGPLLMAQAPVTEATDAYHLQYWANSSYLFAYNEWWYFNLYDEKDDVQAIFTYQVADPTNLTGEGGGDLTAVVYQGGNLIPESDLYPMSAFRASYSAANVTLGPNEIAVTGPNRYTISGKSQDGVLAWNLQFDRVADSWFADDRTQVTPEAWQQMSWLLYMPRAHVTGTLTVEGHTYKVDCSGYHDHNWGEWNFEAVLWNWAQYSQPGLDFDLGDFVGNPNGHAAVDIAGQRTVFSKDQYKLTHTKWAFDPVNNVSYPTQSVFTANNGDVKVNIVMDVQKTAPLATGAPPSLVIYEQPSHFSGTVTIHEGWLPIKIAVDGNGFKEYTATSSAP